MEKSKKQPIFFQRGWEIVAFFDYKHKKTVALGPFGPSGNSFFVLWGLCLGIVIVFNKCYLYILRMPGRARARTRGARARTRHPNSIGRLVKDGTSYAPQLSAPRPPSDPESRDLSYWSRGLHIMRVSHVSIYGIIFQATEIQAKCQLLNGEL